MTPPDTPRPARRTVAHIGAFDLSGSAYVLFCVVGFNLARFSLATPDRMTRVRRLSSTIGRIAAITIPLLAVITVAYPHYMLTAFFAGSLFATIYSALGLDPNKNYYVGSRPIPLVNPGVEPIKAVLS